MKEAVSHPSYWVENETPAGLTVRTQSYYSRCCPGQREWEGFTFVLRANGPNKIWADRYLWLVLWPLLFPGYNANSLYHQNTYYMILERGYSSLGLQFLFWRTLIKLTNDIIGLDLRYEIVRVRFFSILIYPYDLKRTNVTYFN